MMFDQSVLPTLGQEDCNGQYKTHEETIASQGKGCAIIKTEHAHYNREMRHW